MSHHLTATFEYQGFADYWSGNGRRWDDDAGCLFASISNDTTVGDVIAQLVADFNDTGDFEHPIWSDVDSSDIESAIRAMFRDDVKDSDLLEGIEDYEIDDDDGEAPVLIVLLEIDDDDVDDHNSDILSEYFRKVEEWIDDYVQSDDYADGYSYLMSESDQINRSVRKLLEEDPDSYLSTCCRMGEFMGYHTLEKFPESPNYWQVTQHQIDLLVDDVATRILDTGSFDHVIADEYSSESCGYLDSFPIGEYEDQVDVDRIREDIGEKLVGDFFEVLESWLEDQRDFCLRSWGSKSLREQKYPCIYLYVNTGLRIDYVIDDEVLESIVTECIVDYCRRRDFVKGGVA